MFERFTDRARKVMVLAQEEARLLHHGYIGTEHLLLGLIHESEGVAAKALESLGVALDAVRHQVLAIVGRGTGMPGGHVPFTPRAKKVLQLSLQEALELGHNYIGTEHLLLGLIREGEGVAAQALGKLGISLGAVRAKVAELLGETVHLRAAREGEFAEIETQPLVPRCRRCRAELDETLVYRVMDVPAREGHGEDSRPVVVAFCRACGEALGAWAEG